MLGSVREWVRAHVRPSEVELLSPGERRYLASDLALSESELLTLSASGRDNTELMERMMRANGIDPDRMRAALDTPIRDIERVCTKCRNVARCRRELDAGTAAMHGHEYCPNASTFDALAAQ